MKILMTGASGFIGRYVLDDLTEKYGRDNIILLSSGKFDGYNVISSKDHNYERDYLVNNGCYDVEILLHLGAFIPKIGKEADDYEKCNSNITSTDILLKALGKLPHLKKIIYISTIDVYDILTEVLDENSPIKPQTMYGWSKLYCEKMIISACKQSDKQYEILRLGHVYGEGEQQFHKVMPIMIKNAIDGVNINIYGDGETIRTYIYVRDVAQAIVNSLEYDNNAIINIVGNESITINQLAEKIVCCVGTDIKIMHNKTNIQNRNLRFDNSILKNSLIKNFTPFSEGLQNEIEYMKRLDA